MGLKEKASKAKKSPTAWLALIVTTVGLLGGVLGWWADAVRFHDDVSSMVEIKRKHPKLFDEMMAFYPKVSGILRDSEHTHTRLQKQLDVIYSKKKGHALGLRWNESSNDLTIKVSWKNQIMTKTPYTSPWTGLLVWSHNGIEYSINTVYIPI